MSRSGRTRAPARQPAPTEQATCPKRGEHTLDVEHGSYWKGPLPPPAVLEEFGRLVPDAPERIFRRWASESEHRRAYEREALAAAIKRDARGQISALLFALAALSISAFALWLGEPWVAGTIGGGTIATVVGAFLYQRVADKAKSIPQSPPGR